MASLHRRRSIAGVVITASIIVMVIGAAAGSRFAGHTGGVPVCVHRGTCSPHLASAIGWGFFALTCLAVTGLVVGVVAAVRATSSAPRARRLHRPWMAVLVATVISVGLVVLLAMALFMAQFLGAATMLAVLVGSPLLLAAVPSLVWWFRAPNPRAGAVTALVGGVSVYLALLAIVLVDDLASSHLLFAMSDALMVTIALVIVVGGSIITHHRALTRRPGAIG